MIRQRFRNKRENGMLLLLLIASALYFSTSLSFSHDWRKITAEGNRFFQIQGDVRAPGTYSFDTETSLGDLIDVAGGLSIDRDLPPGYKDRPLHRQIRVAVEWSGADWRISTSEISAFNKLTLGIPISINKESKEGLTALPGIGPKLAEKIVKERVKRGGFRNISELKSINGIGEGLYERIESFIID